MLEIIERTDVFEFVDGPAKGQTGPSFVVFAVSKAYPMENQTIELRQLAGHIQAWRMLDELQKRAAAVAKCWDGGDLAEAVRELSFVSKEAHKLLAKGGL